MDNLRLLFVLVLYFVNSYRCDSLTVRTSNGNITGYVEKIGSNSVTVFLGIPYAQPPIGQLRFNPPQSLNLKPSKNIHAKKFKPSCLQDISKIIIPNAAFLESNAISEDCLYLNIYVPLTNNQNGFRRKVMVWIHGGQFQYGSGNTFDALHLAQQGDVIVVTINYRLGVFGFMGTDSGTSGNWGLLDQRMALLWVNQNIGYFGGDVYDVTIFGEEAGGSSVGLHVISPISQTLFTKAVSHGGLNFNDVVTKIPRKYTHILMAVTSCIESGPTMLVRINCLRNIDAEILLRISLNKDMFGPFLPTIDGLFLPSPPYKLYSSQIHNRVPYLVGINTGTRSITTTTASAFLGDIIRTLPPRQTLSDKQYQLFRDTILALVLFHYQSDQTISDGNANIFHKAKEDFELSEILNILKKHAMSSSTFLYSFNTGATTWSNSTAGHLPLMLDNDINYRPSRHSVVHQLIMSAWISFSKTGYPMYDNGNITWQPFNKSQTYLVISPNSSLKVQSIKNLLPNREAILWAKVVPGVLSLVGTNTVSEDIALVDEHDSIDNRIIQPQNDFEKTWGMTQGQLEALLISVVLALLFLSVICIGLVRMIIQPPIFKSSTTGHHQFGHSNRQQNYDNEVFNLHHNSNGQSVTSIELSENKRNYFTSM
ncbi:fatty acyl-CoA hydrolase precursor, medium chain [Patella vulgata]|uniref:fatty acyl-CoA hydrolase precursor, medium chain n=1 Tax=Patella vulgata TaxID=6465 RepID=UPI00217FAB36|nr:fatty acyl-CoA hydrolase precursor, medium chain [Patella vulgata]